MSESFQEFCKRILPAVQAGAEGKKIEHYSAKQWGWGAGRIYAFCTENEYRIAEPELTPLPITPEMWAMIDPRYQWAFLSDDGKSVVCENEPRWGDGMGVAHSTWIVYGALSKLPLNIDTTGIIPELSLTKRPEPVKVKDNQEFKVNVKSFKTAAEMLKELDGVKTAANTPTEDGVRPKNFCSACGSEVNLGVRMRNMYQELLMSIPEKVEEKRDLDELKSQATHYMQANGGKLFFRKFEGEWQLLHESSRLWTSAFIVNHSSLIEIK